MNTIRAWVQKLPVELVLVVGMVLIVGSVLQTSTTSHVKVSIHKPLSSAAMTYPGAEYCTVVSGKAQCITSAYNAFLTTSPTVDQQGWTPYVLNKATGARIAMKWDSTLKEWRDTSATPVYKTKIKVSGTIGGSLPPAISLDPNYPLLIKWKRPSSQWPGSSSVYMKLSDYTGTCGLGVDATMWQEVVNTDGTKTTSDSATVWVPNGSSATYLSRGIAMKTNGSVWLKLASRDSASENIACSALFLTQDTAKVTFAGSDIIPTLTWNPNPPLTTRLDGLYTISFRISVADPDGGYLPNSLKFTCRLFKEDGSTYWALNSQCSSAFLSKLGFGTSGAQNTWYTMSATAGGSTPPPGNYTFQVIALDSISGAVSQPLKWAFQILPATPAICGDGVKEGTEFCDLGANNSNLSGSGCTTSCLNNFCGNSVQDGTVREECDRGAQNGVAGSLCTSLCRNTLCGNNVINSGEQCDKGSQNGVSGSTCSSSCQTVVLPPPPQPPPPPSPTPSPTGGPTATELNDTVNNNNICGSAENADANANDCGMSAPSSQKRLDSTLVSIAAPIVNRTPRIVGNSSIGRPARCTNCIEFQAMDSYMLPGNSQQYTENLGAYVDQSSNRINNGYFFSVSAGGHTVVVDNHPLEWKPYISWSAGRCDHNATSFNPISTNKVAVYVPNGSTACVKVLYLEAGKRYSTIVEAGGSRYSNMLLGSEDSSTSSKFARVSAVDVFEPIDNALLADYGTALSLKTNVFGRTWNWLRSVLHIQKPKSEAATISGTFPQLPTLELTPDVADIPVQRFTLKRDVAGTPTTERGTAERKTGAGSQQSAPLPVYQPVRYNSLTGRLDHNREEAHCDQLYGNVGAVHSDVPSGCGAIVGGQCTSFSCIFSSDVTYYPPCPGGQDFCYSIAQQGTVRLEDTILDIGETMGVPVRVVSPDNPKPSYYSGRVQAGITGISGGKVVVNSPNTSSLTRTAFALQLETISDSIAQHIKNADLYLDRDNFVQTDLLTEFVDPNGRLGELFKHSESGSWQDVQCPNFGSGAFASLGRSLCTNGVKAYDVLGKKFAIQDITTGASINGVRSSAGIIFKLFEVGSSQADACMRPGSGICDMGFILNKTSNDYQLY